MRGVHTTQRLDVHNVIEEEKKEMRAGPFVPSIDNNEKRKARTISAGGSPRFMTTGGPAAAQ
jgi:hypothetical protein